MIENCFTGIKYNGVSVLLPLNITSVHFEQNNVDIELNDNGISDSQSSVNITSCAFILTKSTNAILIGRRTNLKAENCYFDGCGVNEIGTNYSLSCYYISMNNMFYSRGNSNYTNGYEIHNNICSKIKESIIYGDILQADTVTSKNINGLSFDVANKTILALNEYNFGTKESGIKDLWVNNLFQLPTFTTADRPTPTRGGAIIFDSTLCMPIYWSGRSWYNFKDELV